MQVSCLGGKIMDPCLLPEALMSLLKATQPPIVLDVRRRPAFEAAPAMLPGAMWRDPHAVEQWAAELSSGCSIVVYCVHGHEVSRGVRDALRRRGLMASIIEGGIEGWRAAGGPIVPAQKGDRP
jgi:rhodanese-related sulfurtransferase